MAQKKGRGDIFKHAAFMRDSGFPQVTDHLGISVITEINLANFDNITTHFRSDFTTIFLVLKGNLKGSLNLEEYDLGPDSLLILSPNTSKRLVSFDKGCVASGLSFTMDFLVEIGMPAPKVELYDYFTTKYSPHWQLNNEDAQLISALFKQISTRAHNFLYKTPYAKELLHHTFSLLVYELAAMGAKYTEIKNPNISRKESLVMNFTTLVQEQFRQQRNLQQYAEQLFVTAKYLTETVKELTGKNAGEVIDDFVMLEAKLLLDDPKLSIAQIAELLHFSDQSFFGKFFKRHTGYAPSQFRSIHL